MLIEPRRNILIGPLLQIALNRCWAQRDDLLRLGTVPLVLIVAIVAPLSRTVEAMRLSMTPQGVSDPDLVAQSLLLAIAYGLVVAVFSVNWLRQLTLGKKAAPGLGLSLNMRHLRFFCAVLSIAMAAIVPVMLLLYPVFIVTLQGEAAMLAVVAMGFLVWAALLARLSPSWIGIAIDAPMRLSLAWKRTAGQGFKLVVAMLAVEVAAMVGQQAIAILFDITGLSYAAPMSYVLITATLDLLSISLELAVLVTAFPYFLRETV
jgi:hypothetical protein